jgi:DNA-directed RNA polymerase subunit M/transcription elongation factor TFIIS
MKWCPKCDNYLYHSVNSDQLIRTCRNCGYSENDTEGGLVVETRVGERASEGYKILLNEFTTKDPVLPHAKNIKCPNGGCASNTGAAERDVIYMKYDAVNLKYIYICMVCDKRWRSH